jgi:hypothetical protein
MLSTSEVAIFMTMRRYKLQVFFAALWLAAAAIFIWRREKEPSFTPYAAMVLAVWGELQIAQLVSRPLFLALAPHLGHVSMWQSSRWLAPSRHQPHQIAINLFRQAQVGLIPVRCREPCTCACNTYAYANVR